MFGVGGAIPEGCSGFSPGLGEVAQRKQGEGFSSGRLTSLLLSTHSTLVSHIARGKNIERSERGEQKGVARGLCTWLTGYPKPVVGSTQNLQIRIVALTDHRDQCM